MPASATSRARAAACALIAAAAVCAPTAAGAGIHIEQTPPAPSAVMPGGTMPTIAAARSILRQRLKGARKGSMVWRDLRWISRLAARYDRPGQPAGRRATIRRILRVNAWWFARYSAPGRRVVLRDVDGIISTYKERHGFLVNPVATMGRWRGLNRDVPNPILAHTILQMGVWRRAGGQTFRVWEYYDVAGHPQEVRPGVSSMAQVRAALLFSQAFRQTGNPGFAKAEYSALKALLVPVNDGGGVSMVAYPPGRPGSPWYVERAYPHTSPWTGAALNGFMVTLLDLERVSEVLGRPKLPPRIPETAYDPPPVQVAEGRDLSRQLVDAGIVTLKRYLPLHDTGHWSLYGLLTPGYGWRKDVADLNYHCYHIALLRQLDANFPGQGFGGWANRWQGYVKAQHLSCPHGGAPATTATATG